MSMFGKVLNAGAIGASLAMAAFTQPSWAQTAGVSSSAATPQQRAAAASVLRIFSFANPGAQPPAKIATASLPPLPLNALRFPLPPNLRAAFQGEACRLNGLEWCPIFKEETRGTAFAVDQPGRFMTCRHLVQDWLYWAAAYNQRRKDMMSIIPPIAMADAEGKLLFISVAPGAGGYTATLFANSERLEAPLPRLLKGNLFWDADFLRFDLSDNLGIRPLRRKEGFAAGESAALIGFPDRAGNESLSLARIARGSIRALAGSTWSTGIASSRGMSGGPIVDDAGQAAAMSCSLQRNPTSGGGRADGTWIDPGQISRRLQDIYGVAVTGP